jgi:hypothetical protein
MGCLSSKETVDASRRNKVIDIQIKKDRQEQEKEVKLLLLGTIYARILLSIEIRM